MTGALAPGVAPLALVQIPKTLPIKSGYRTAPLHGVITPYPRSDITLPPSRLPALLGGGGSEALKALRGGWWARQY